MSKAPEMAVGPPGSPEWLIEAALAGGARVVPIEEATSLLWAAPDDAAGLRDVLDRHGHHIEWVQLPWAGIEPYASVLDDDRVWSAAKGVYAEPVAEMALALLLATMRGIDRYAKSTSWLEYGRIGVNLKGASVTVLGGGGITEVLLRLLGPFDARVTVVRNHPEPMPGAAAVTGPTNSEIDGAITGADALVVALALTPETEGIVDLRRLSLLHDRSVVVNVARGRHIVTDDLVTALREQRIMGAGLDVTDPEPLPDDHPLWTMANCIITPHVGNTPEMARPLLAQRVTTNVRRWIEGDPPIGVVDVAAGY